MQHKTKNKTRNKTRNKTKNKKQNKKQKTKNKTKNKKQKTKKNKNYKIKKKWGGLIERTIESECHFHFKGLGKEQILNDEEPQCNGFSSDLESLAIFRQSTN